MKKILTWGVALSILLCGSAFAGTAVKTTSSNVVKDAKVTSINDQHRVIVEYAKAALGNAYSNDWDNSISSAPMSKDEIAWLKTVTGLASGTVYFIDLTGKTYVGYSAAGLGSMAALEQWLKNNPSPFQNTSEIIDQWVDTKTSYSYVDGELKAVTESQPYVTVKNTTYEIIWKGYDVSPIVLDLDSNRAIDTAFGVWTKHAPKFFGQYAKFFDITGDGQEDYTEWMVGNANDGLLVMPENGKVESALQLFGTAGGYKDGYEKLSLVCDKDKNGWVEGGELEGLAIWRDINSDGVCQSNELSSLDDYQITAVSTNHSNYVSAYKKADGSVNTAWDWWPCVSETRKFRN